MNPWFKMLFVAILFGSGVAAGVKWDANSKNKIIADNKAAFEHERLTWTQAVLKQQQAVTTEVMEKDALKTRLGVEHAKNKAAVDDLFRVVSTDRVPNILPTLPCTANNPPDPAVGSNDGAAGSRAFPDKAQTAFDDFTRGLEEQAHYADTLIENCRVMKLFLIDPAK